MRQRPTTNNQTSRFHPKTLREISLALYDQALNVFRRKQKPALPIVTTQPISNTATTPTTSINPTHELKVPAQSLFNNQQVIDYARGRWPEIFNHYGIDTRLLLGKHAKCPIHGGKDGFRYTNDRGNGEWVCATCTRNAFKDGVALIARVCFNNDNDKAFKSLAHYLGLGYTQHHGTQRDLLPFPTTLTVTLSSRSESAEQEREQAKHQAAIGHTDAILAQCEWRTHPYLLDKGLEQQGWVTTQRYTLNYQKKNAMTQQWEATQQHIYPNALIIPVYDLEKPEHVVGAQFINPNGAPYYVHGSRMAVGIHCFEGDERLGYVGVCEGYATGLSVHLMTGATVIVAFDARGLEQKARALAALFPNHQFVFFGDHDMSQTGQSAAHQAAVMTRGKAIIPLIPGKDWDDMRQDIGLEATRAEINRQIADYGQSIAISEVLTGLSLNSTIVLSETRQAVSFHDALVHHVGEYCRCPLSGQLAIINAGVIYSFKLKRLIIPILASLYDAGFIAECKAIHSLQGRLKWVAQGGTQHHLYALIMTIRHRLKADLPSHEQFNAWLHEKIGMTAAPELLSFMQCVQESRHQQARRLTELNANAFPNQLPLKQVVQADGSSQLDWQPAIEVAKINRYKLIAVKAQHGQGKTQGFIKTLFAHANTEYGGIVVAHRTRLMTQISRQLGCYHYQDYCKDIAGLSLSALRGMAVCLHSFKHDHLLAYLKQAHSIFIDEASQVLKTLYSDPHIDATVIGRFSDACQEAACIYLTDADLTTEDIKHYQTLLNIKDNEILVVTAEAPIRHYQVTLSCSAAPAHYKTTVMKAIEQDLHNNCPAILAVESKTQGKRVFQWLTSRFPDKAIRLITGETPDRELSHFIDDIDAQTAQLDLLIHTSIIGTGVSVQHANQRFKKGYGLFSGNVLHATECVQMMRRFRDITTWEVGLLCRPDSLFMTSFYRDLGTQALQRNDIAINTIGRAIRLNHERHKTLFIHELTHLLRHEYGFTLLEQRAATTPIEGMVTTAAIRAQDIEQLVQAPTIPLEKALLARKKGYGDEAERYRAEAALCRDYFKCTTLTELEADLWCNPTARDAASKQEQLINILNLDTTIPDVAKKQAILTQAGITLDLFKRQQLSQVAIRTLRDSIASQCAELVGLGFLKERYVKADKIPDETPIKFIKEVLKQWGFVVETVQTGNEHKERRLNLAIPEPMSRRLNLDTRTDKEKCRDQAMRLKNEGMGYGLIAKELGLKKWQVQRLLK